MEKIQYNNHLHLNYLDEINKKFNWKKVENEVIEKEVEFKIFVEWKSKQKDYEGIQNDIISKLFWEVIFNWAIKDTRYYDVKNKNESILNENNISVVRVREQEDFKDYNNSDNKEYIQKKYIYTVKKFDDDWYSTELEDDSIGNNFWKEILENEKWLIEIKETKKKRKEIKFKIDINWKKEEVKVAFDEHFDKENSFVEWFFEVEAKSEEIANAWFEQIKKLDSFKDLRYKKTKGWIEKIKKDKIREKLIKKLESFDWRVLWIRKELISLLINLLEEEDIYEIRDNIENTKKWKDKILENKILENKIKKLIEKQLDKIIEKSDYKIFFHRIITNSDTENSPRKKFYDKLNREYSGYLEAFSKNLLLNLKNTEDLSFVSINKLLSEKIDIFLKSIFILDDYLTKEEFENFLSIWDKKIINHFNEYRKSIELLFLNYDVNFVDIWWKWNNNRIIQKLLTPYSRALQSTATWKSIFFDKEKIEEKLNSYEREQFIYLSRSFWKWLLNSWNRDLETIDTVKKLFLEDFYHTFLLKNNKLWLSWSRNDDNVNEEFDQKFVNKILEENKKNIFNEGNFLWKEIWPQLLEYLLNNIFIDTKILSVKIESDFKTYNNEINSSIWKNFEHKKWSDALRKLEKNELEFSELTFNVWEKLKIEPRLQIFIKKILKFDEKWIFLNTEIMPNHGAKFETKIKNFAEVEFNKILKKPKKSEIEKNKEYNEKLENYISWIKNQLSYLRKYFLENEFDKNITDIEKIIFLAKNDINSFQLLVTWFHFNLIDKPKEEEIKDETFAEKVLNWVDIQEGVEFYTSISSWYNLSFSSPESIIEKHDRIWNAKSIELWENFYFEIDWNRNYFKDFMQLYIPEWTVDYGNSKVWLDFWLDTVRKLRNSQTVNKNDDYLISLNKIWFPIEDKIALNKLLEFQKLISKIILPHIEKINKNNSEATNTLSMISWEVVGRDYCEIKVAEPKSFEWLLRKAIIKYWWDIEKVADWARWTTFWKDFYHLQSSFINFTNTVLKNSKVKALRFEDKIWNPFKKSKRKNWYRDASLVLILENWETSEFQFHFKPYYDIKTWDLKINWHNLEIFDDKNKKGSIFKDLKLNLKEKLIKEDNFLLTGEDTLFFTEEEKNIINNFCKNSQMKIPKTFSELYDFSQIKDLQLEENLKFNADYTYNLERTLWVNYPEIAFKLQRLDKILFDIADWEIAAKEIYRIMKKTKK